MSLSRPSKRSEIWIGLANEIFVSKKGNTLTNSDNSALTSEELLSDDEFEAQRRAKRENAKRLMRESDLANMLRTLNKDELKERGRFEEYDALILLKWGTGYTGRHIWIELVDDTIRFRLNEHLRCTAPVPQCDGEYHTFVRSMWRDRDLLWSELKKYYAHPVAESSSD